VWFSVSYLENKFIKMGYQAGDLQKMRIVKTAVRHGNITTQIDSTRIRVILFKQPQLCACNLGLCLYCSKVVVKTTRTSMKITIMSVKITRTVSKSHSCV
jgi:hypothetical protein